MGAVDAPADDAQQPLPQTAAAAAAAAPAPPKAKRRKTAPAPIRASTTYQLYGVRLCRTALLAIFRLSHAPLERISKAMRVSRAFPMKTAYRRGKSTVGKARARTKKALSFLDGVASRDGLPSPDARGAKPGQPVIFLPQTMPKRVVFKMYVEDATARREERPIGENAFCFAWRHKRRFIRIATRITDYCETCTRHQKTATETSAAELALHRATAKLLREQYRARVLASRAPESGVLHLTMDFAERVYLPFEHKQPSQRFFLTGLKYDFFGISNDTAGFQVTYGLAEGHWPDEKTANTVFSMLHHFLASELTAREARTLQLTADNCAGQNKNRWMPWYFAWRTIVGLHDVIDVSFLVAGHTKNMCDARFALIKRQMKQEEGMTPVQMAEVIAHSSFRQCCVTGNQVTWHNWKLFLERFFKAKIKGLAKYHFFRFCATEPGVVLCGDSSATTDLKRVKLLAPGASVEQVRAAAADLATTLMPAPEITQERKGYLMREIIRRYFLGTMESLTGPFFSA